MNEDYKIILTICLIILLVCCTSCCLLSKYVRQHFPLLNTTISSNSASISPA